MLGHSIAPPLRTKRTLEHSLDFVRDLAGPGPLTADAEVTEPAAPARSASSPSAPVKPEPQPKPAYPPAAAKPTQHGPEGVRFDFNLGCRVSVPPGQWRIKLRDLDTGNILYETEVKEALVSSRKRYYLRCGIEVFAGGKLVFEHRYSAENRDVLIQFPVGTLGDVLAWFPFAARFADVHRCRLTCAMSGLIIPLLRDAYPQIRFVTHEEVRPELYYATYYMGLFFDDADNTWQPCDFRHVGLHRTAAYILGVDPAEQSPLLALPDESRPIVEPYVCIAAQSSSQAKYWNNPHGWREVVAHLEAGRLSCHLHRPKASAWRWSHLEPHPARGGRRDWRPTARRACALAAARRSFYRAVERVVMACLGRRYADSAHQRLHSSDQ